jgi:hypothetical protein
MVQLILSNESYEELLVAVEEQVESARSYWKHAEPEEQADAQATLDRAESLQREVQRGSTY